MSSKNGYQIIDRLLKQGYIELDDQVIDIYRGGFGQKGLEAGAEAKADARRKLEEHSTNTGNYGAVFNISGYQAADFNFTPEIAQQRAKNVEQADQVFSMKLDRAKTLLAAGEISGMRLLIEMVGSQQAGDLEITDEKIDSLD